MKHTYLLLIVLFSFNLSFAQDDIYGNWFVQSINTVNVQHDSYLPVTLNFSETAVEYQDYDNYFAFEGITLCNGYSGSYSLIDENTLSILEFAQLDSCSNSDADGRYYFKYADIIMPVFSNDSPPTIPLNYTIVGTGQDQVLTIIKSNGDFAVYGRQEPTETIFKTWHSYSTETADGIIYPSPLDLTTLEISPQSFSAFGMGTFGSGGCNTFDANHDIYSSNENEFNIYLFNQTLVECNDNTYEPTYFSVLSNEADATFSYELQDNGNTLVLTNIIGDVLTFGEQAPPPNIINEWFLYYLVIDSNQIDRPEGTLPIIEFTTNPDSDGFYYGGIVACTGYGGSYNFNPQQTFDAVYLNTTLGNPCDTNEENTFEDLYFYSVLDNPDDNATELDYEITGTGDDATLVVTNLLNGNQAYYGRQTLSIDDNEFNSSEISLIRNPVSNSLDLSMTQNLIGSHYEIFSMTGQRIANGVLNSNSINVNQLYSGLYFLKVSSDDTSFETVKFIKE